VKGSYFCGTELACNIDDIQLVSGCDLASQTCHCLLQCLSRPGPNLFYDICGVLNVIDQAYTGTSPHISTNILRAESKVLPNHGFVMLIAYLLDADTLYMIDVTVRDQTPPILRFWPDIWPA